MAELKDFARFHGDSVNYISRDVAPLIHVL